jgi:DNA-binding transcriptional LysR family regulator
MNAPFAPRERQIHPPAIWQGLHLFAQVVEAGTITAAASQLGVSKSSVSARISALEAALGVRLLARSKVGVQPTGAGARMLAHATDLFSQLDTALQDVRKDKSSPEGVLRISMPAGIADPMLVPLLARFLQRHPNIRLEVQATDSLLEMRQSGIDVALRFGWVKDGDFIARKVCQYREVICASPRYLSANSAINTPQDLSNHSWIGFTGFGGAQQCIEMRDGSRRRHRVTVRCRVRTCNAPSQKYWALEGAGLTRLPQFAVAEELRTGRLESVLDRYTLDGPSLYVIHLADRYKTAMVKALLAFLEEASAELHEAARA